MQGTGPAHKSTDAALPKVAVAGEFCSGKSSLINLLLRQRVLRTSIMLQTQLPTRLRHSDEMMVSALGSDGKVVQVHGLEELGTPDDITEISVHLPFREFQGIEIEEVPAPAGAVFDACHRETAASADVLLWCTISSQPWRLSEKDCISQIGRDTDQKTILCVMRDDLIRSDSDRAKINRRLQTEAKPFFSEIVFIDASNRSLLASATDLDTWHRSGAGALAATFKELPGASTPPVPDIAEDEAALSSATPHAPADIATNIVPFADCQGKSGATSQASQKGQEPDDDLDELIDQAMAILLGALGDMDGCNYASIVIDEKHIAENCAPERPSSVFAARALFLAQMRSSGHAGPVEEMIIRAKQETHFLAAIDEASHIHLLLEPSAATLASVRSAVRKLAKSSQTSG
jgi:hypothetical protein